MARTKRHKNNIMEIRDPVHGSIAILDEEVPIIEHPLFQRLRNIKQLGLSEYAFPGATHTRYLHSIGVCHVATLIFNKIFPTAQMPKADFLRLRETVRIACLLHDIGHAPLSHATECIMPLRKNLKLPTQLLKFLPKDQRATHEDYTLKSILDSSLSEAFKLINAEFGVTPRAVASLISGFDLEPSYFLIQKKNYFPVLHQLVSSELDCDRMDYLLRDSYFCGVSYGKIDLDWIINSLSLADLNNEIFLALSQRSISTFDDFLLSRFHMFLMIYFHYRSVCLEQMLHRYFNSADNGYFFPIDIEDYQNHDDHYLIKILRNSKNSWAQKIISNSIPTKIFETYGPHLDKKFLAVEQILKNAKIDFIKCESKGRLSKYYEKNQEQKYNLQIEKQYSATNDRFMNLKDATRLFERYSETHAVKRIHANIEKHPQLQNQISKILKQ